MSEGLESEVVTEDAAEPQDVIEISLKDFRPSGYRKIAWEVASGTVPQMRFDPLQLEVIESAHAQDNFFESFDNPTVNRTGIYQEKKEGALAAAPISNPNVDIENLLAQKLEEGKTLGVAEGYNAAKAEFEAQIAAERENIKTFVQSLETQSQNFFAKSEKEALQFALSVAKEIVQVAAEAKPEYIIDIIRKGLKACGSSTPLRIRVSPADYEFIQVVGLPVELTADDLGVVYVSDESITSGCVIENNYGEVDLQLDSMWEQIRASLRELFS